MLGVVLGERHRKQGDAEILLITLKKKSHGELTCQKSDDWREQMALANALGVGGSIMGDNPLTAQLNHFTIGVFKLNPALQMPQGYNKPVKAFSLSL